MNAEADVHKLNAELEGRVTERTVEVSKALTALQESEERGRLILSFNGECPVCRTVGSQPS